VSLVEYELAKAAI